MEIRALLTGGIESLAAGGVVSGINKKPVQGRQWVSATGLITDRQADLKHHGGFDKAVHHYAYEHYAWWQNIQGITRPEVLCEGGFGENISTVGMDESNVCIGDIYKAGSVILEVSQARQPCWKLNLRFGHPDISRLVQENLRTGWYYRVLQEGWMQAGDDLTLLERPWSGWTLKRMLHILYIDTNNKHLLEEMSQITPLSESWKNTLRQRLETGRTEDWNKRLYNRIP